jgi:hypothetical protein
VNEVEFLGKEPLVFYVVYLETAVWWDTFIVSSWMMKERGWDERREAY